jgi:hypothetical protein
MAGGGGSSAGSMLMSPHALRDLLEPTVAFSAETRSARVRLSCLELHAVRPWAIVLSVRERDKDRQATQVLQVWDYQQKLVLQEVSLEDIDWQFDAVGPQRPPGKRGLEVGAVSCLKLIDQAAPQRDSLSSSSLFGENRGAAGQRQWVAVLGEHRTLLLDLDAMAFRELSFETTTPKKGGRQHPTTCVVVDGPGSEQTLLACALDDEIHLLSTQSWEPFAPPLLRNKKEVTHLVACTGRQRGMLVSGSEDGLLLLWDLAKREAVKSSKAHEAGLVCVSYNPGESQLVTSGKEGVIRTWALPSLEQQWEVRPPDGVAHAVHCRHPALALDGLWLFRPDGQPAAWCMRGQAMENRVHEVLRVAKADTPGIEELVVHPLQPHLLVMLTSGGLWVYTLGAQWTPSVAVTKTEVEPSQPIRAERRTASAAIPPTSSIASIGGRSDADERHSQTVAGISNRSRTGSGLTSDSASGYSQLHSAGMSAESLPIHWTVEQVGSWLDQIGLGVHRATFLENEVDGRLLLKLTADEIKHELGVTSGLQAKKIVSKVELLQGASVSASPHGTKQQPDQMVKRGPAVGARGGDEVVRHETREAFFVANQSLLSVKFTASSDSLPHLQCEDVHKHRTLPYPGVTTVAFSASGDYISIVFAESQRYEILKISDMRRLDAGHTIDLKWAHGGTQGGADRYAVLQSHENYKEDITGAVQSFNAKPQKGIDQLLIQKKCNGDPEDIARFLLRTEGLNMQMIGEYLGKNSEFNQIVLRAYINQLDFKGQMVDQAMRTMYACFIPPGESQQIERINKEFADRYVRQNPTVFHNPGNVEFMGFAIMMLNTDLHNPNIEEKRRMRVEQFIRNTRSPDTESDPACSPEACTEIYHRIASEEIKLKTGDEGGLFLKAPADQYELPDNRIGKVVVKSLYQDDTNLVGYVEMSELGTKICGGCMIGVERPGGDDGPDRPRRKRSFQWYNWQTLEPVGEALPAPTVIEWDPEMRYCLTAYKDAFYIWTTYPTFRRQGGPFPGNIVDAIWSQGRLLYSTHDTVCCLYPTHADEGPIILATLDAPLRTSVERSASGGRELTSGSAAQPFPFGFDDSFSPPPQHRPAGALALLRVVQEQLIVMDASNSIISLSLAHQALRLRQLVVSARPPLSQSNAEQILELALALCPGSEHDAVASFFEQGFDDGDPLAKHFGELSMHLPGLSSVGRLRVCLDTHLHSQAAVALQALVEELDTLEATQSSAVHLNMPLLRHHLLLAHLVVVAACEEAGVNTVAIEALNRAAAGYPEVFQFVSAVARAQAAAAAGVPLPATATRPAGDAVAAQAQLVFTLIGRTHALAETLKSFATADISPTPIREHGVANWAHGSSPAGTPLQPTRGPQRANSSPTGDQLAFSQTLPPPPTPPREDAPPPVVGGSATVSRLQLVGESAPAGLPPPPIAPAPAPTPVVATASPVVLVVAGGGQAGPVGATQRSVSTNPFSPMVRAASAQQDFEL